MNHSMIAPTLARGIHLSVVVALLGMVFIVTTPPVAHASTYDVDTNADNPALIACTTAPDDCSLRGAITNANTNPGPDSITFAAATNGTTIVLFGVVDEDGNATGDLDILDGGNLTIQGNGAANTIIDGGGIDRVFHVCPSGGCDNAVILSGVTIQDGGDVVHGGGIFNAGGTTTVDSCTVSANTSSYGGGILNLATLIVQNGSIIGGTGMGNVVTKGGGGIYNSSGTTTVVNSAIISNLALESGGGIYNWAGTTTVNGGTVYSNTAPVGGGIYNRATLSVQNGSAIGGTGAGNEATQFGGGIYNYAGVATVDGSTVSANTSLDGGGIYNRATLTVTNGSAIGVAGAGNEATNYGGGLYNYAGTTTVDGSTVSANTSLDGGGIYNWGTLNVQNGSAIGVVGAGNEVTEKGGGIFNKTGGITTVNGSTVSANTAHNGGGIYNKATLNVQSGSTIGGVGMGNQATGNYAGGGGIYNDAGGTTTVDGSAVSANTAYDGGGIYNEATLNVQNGSTIGGVGMGNQVGRYGGGISSRTGGTMTLNGSTVIANTAKYGGGINNQGTLTVTNGGTIGVTGAGNQATESGGGISNTGSAIVDGGAVSANTAKYGGGISNRGTLNLTNSTIGGYGGANQASILGGGIQNWTGSTTVTGSCILNNWATINGGGLYNDVDSFGATNVTGSSIVGNSATSFFNNQAPEQNATGNWWGAASGPNTPGADTVGGIVDTSGYLTEPIPSCLYRVYLPLALDQTP